jgi:hypothetical protein
MRQKIGMSQTWNWHNVVNGFGATNSFSRRDPANPTGADPHNRMDECGSSGVPHRSVAGAESRSARFRWRQECVKKSGGSS